MVSAWTYLLSEVCAEGELIPAHHQVIVWMNRAYEAAAQGNPEETFHYWERAYRYADVNEKRWLDQVERRRIMNEAYEQSARTCLHHATFIYDQELSESKESLSFTLHEHRRNKRVVEWEQWITRAYEHASEIPHRALITCIHEARINPLRPFWRSRINQFFVLR